MIYGIIAEYNPFHNGHKYQLDYIRRQDADAKIIVAMSGHTTQRGDFPVLDKWTRAQAAVESGADLVVELPAAFSMRSAEGFATGGVKLLAKCGIDYLAFGTEFPDRELLLFLAGAMDTPAVQAAIKAKMSDGLAYPAAAGAALEEYTAMTPPTIVPARTPAKDLTDNLNCSQYINDKAWGSKILQDANSILALEYVRALKIINLSAGCSKDKNSSANSSKAIDIFPIQRTGTGHNGKVISTPESASNTSHKIASGSRIRQLLYKQQRIAGSPSARTCSPDIPDINNNLQSAINPAAASIRELVPPTIYTALQSAVQQHSLPEINQIMPALRWRLTTMNIAELQEIYTVNEGLEYSLKNAAYATDLNELLTDMTSRRYTRTRIMRLLLYVLLGVTKNYISEMDQLGPLYARPLAFNSTGQELLKQIKKRGHLQPVTKVTSIINRRDLYNIKLCPISLSSASVTTNASIPNYESMAEAPKESGITPAYSSLCRQLYLDILTTQLFAQMAPHTNITSPGNSKRLQKAMLSDFFNSPKIF